jgi:hypothetical protein
MRGGFDLYGNYYPNANDALNAEIAIGNILNIFVITLDWFALLFIFVSLELHHSRSYTRSLIFSFLF